MRHLPLVQSRFWAITFACPSPQAGFQHEIFSGVSEDISFCLSHAPTNNKHQATRFPVESGNDVPTPFEKVVANCECHEFFMCLLSGKTQMSARWPVWFQKTSEGRSPSFSLGDETTNQVCNRIFIVLHFRIFAISCYMIQNYEIAIVVILHTSFYAIVDSMCLPAIPPARRLAAGPQAPVSRTPGAASHSENDTIKTTVFLSKTISPWSPMSHLITSPCCFSMH